MAPCSTDVMVDHTFEDGEGETGRLDRGQDDGVQAVKMSKGVQLLQEVLQEVPAQSWSLCERCEPQLVTWELSAYAE